MGDLTPYVVTIFIVNPLLEEYTYRVRAANEDDAVSAALREIDKVLESREDHDSSVDCGVEFVSVRELNR